MKLEVILYWNDERVTSHKAEFKDEYFISNELSQLLNNLEQGALVANKELIKEHGTKWCKENKGYVDLKIIYNDVEFMGTRTYKDNGNGIPILYMPNIIAEISVVILRGLENIMLGQKL